MPKSCAVHARYKVGCTDCCAVMRLYYWSTREKRLAWRRAWYERTRDERNRVRRASYPLFRERTKKENARWLSSPKGQAWHKDYAKFYALHRNYGLSREEYIELLAKQNGRCPICERKLTKIQVDHDHETGEIRALLCPRCNTLLGLARDTPDLLERAAKFLKSRAVEIRKDERPHGHPYAAK